MIQRNDFWRCVQVAATYFMAMNSKMSGAEARNLGIVNLERSLTAARKSRDTASQQLSRFDNITFVCDDLSDDADEPTDAELVVEELW